MVLLTPFDAVIFSRSMEIEAPLLSSTILSFSILIFCLLIFPAVYFCFIFAGAGSR